MCPGTFSCAKPKSTCTIKISWAWSTPFERMPKPTLPRGSESKAKQTGSAFKVFHKAETGMDVPDTNIHYHKVIAESCKMAFSWPIPHSLIITKKSIQFVIGTMKITVSKIYRSGRGKKPHKQYATRSFLTDLNLHCCI